MASLKHFLGPQSIVRQGGYFVLTTPFSWLTQFTPKNQWLGSNEPGASEDSLTALKRILSDEYELLREDHIPFVIREHKRKFELVYPSLTVWRRK
jgi:hypothetical protein